MDFYIISTNTINELTNGIINEEITELEEKLKKECDKYKNLTIIKESDFLKYVTIRSQNINDDILLNLIKKA